MSSNSETMQGLPTANDTFNVEYSQTFNTGSWRTSTKVSDFPRVVAMRSMFAKVDVVSLSAEVRQNAFVGGEAHDLDVKGHIFLALIPTCKDTDAATGASAAVVTAVPNKFTFPLSSTSQNCEVLNFPLVGFETDVAQDPRRGAGIVAWIGNSGAQVHNGVRTALPICTVTWRLTLQCSGATTTW